MRHHFYSHSMHWQWSKWRKCRKKKLHMTLRIMYIMYNLNTCTEPLWAFVLCKMKSVTFKCDSKSDPGKPEVILSSYWNLHHVTACNQPGSLFLLWLWVRGFTKNVIWSEMQTCFSVAVNFWMIRLMGLIQFAWASFQKQSAFSLCWRDLLAAICWEQLWLKSHRQTRVSPPPAADGKSRVAAGSFNHAGVLLNQGSLRARASLHMMEAEAQGHLLEAVMRDVSRSLVIGVLDTVFLAEVVSLCPAVNYLAEWNVDTTLQKICPLGAALINTDCGKVGPHCDWWPIIVICILQSNALVDSRRNCATSVCTCPWLSAQRQNVS